MAPSHPRRTLLEELRQANERRLEDALHDRGKLSEALAIAENARSRTRAWVAFALLMIMSDVLVPVRAIMSYPSSWAYKDAALSFWPGALALWMAAAAALMVPFLWLIMVSPGANNRRSVIGMACTGLGMGAFGFGMMAYLVARFDAPQASNPWALSSISCAVAMLMLAGAVNSEQNVRKACEVLTPCE